MPILQHKLQSGEGFFQNEYLSVGLSAYGALGTVGAASTLRLSARVLGSYASNSSGAPP